VLTGAQQLIEELRSPGLVPDVIPDEV
jgi:hypothetical protein